MLLQSRCEGPSMSFRCPEIIYHTLFLLAFTNAIPEVSVRAWHMPGSPGILFVAASAALFLFCVSWGHFCKKWENWEVQVNQKGMILHSLHLYEVWGFLLYCTDLIRIRFPLYLPLTHFPGLPWNKEWFIFCTGLTIASHAHCEQWYLQ